MTAWPTQTKQLFFYGAMGNCCVNNYLNLVSGSCLIKKYVKVKFCKVQNAGFLKPPFRHASETVSRLFKQQSRSQRSRYSTIKELY